ncbi:hypothetical protein GQ42DRAFT_152782 [Ramicandelaber brevisporus]|nr:hypothetical protein GQ42DRAFT_152782 [Ramicandelaber brevisporus]
MSVTTMSYFRLFDLPLDLLELLTLYFEGKEAVKLLTLSSNFHEIFARSVWRIIGRRVIDVAEPIRSSAYARYGHLVDMETNRPPFDLETLATVLVARHRDPSKQSLRELTIVFGAADDEEEEEQDNPWTELSAFVQTLSPLRPSIKLHIKVNRNYSNVVIPTPTQMNILGPHLTNLPDIDSVEDEYGCVALHNRKLFSPSGTRDDPLVFGQPRTLDINVCCASPLMYDYSDFTPLKFPVMDTMTINENSCRHQTEEGAKPAIQTLLLQEWPVLKELKVYFGKLTFGTLDVLIEFNPQLTTLIMGIRCNSNDTDGVFMFERVAGRLPHLTAFDLSGDLSISVDSDWLQGACLADIHSSKLTSVSISKTMLKPRFFEVLLALPNLQDVSFWECVLIEPELVMDIFEEHRQSAKEGGKMSVTKMSVTTMSYFRLFDLPLDLLELLTLYFEGKEAVKLLTLSSNFHEIFARSVWRIIGRRVIDVAEPIRSSAYARYGHLVRSIDLLDKLDLDFDSHNWAQLFPNTTSMAFDIFSWIDYSDKQTFMDAIADLHGLRSLEIKMETNIPPFDLKTLTRVLVARHGDPTPTPAQMNIIRPHLTSVPDIDEAEDEYGCVALHNRQLFSPSGTRDDPLVFGQLCALTITVCCTSPLLFDYSDFTPTKFPVMEWLNISGVICRRQSEDGADSAIQTLLTQKWPELTFLRVHGSGLTFTILDKLVEFNPQLTRLSIEIRRNTVDTDGVFMLERAGYWPQVWLTSAHPS